MPTVNYTIHEVKAILEDHVLKASEDLKVRESLRANPVSRIKVTSSIEHFDDEGKKSYRDCDYNSYKSYFKVTYDEKD